MEYQRTQFDEKIYAQLKTLANKLMARERENHTLSPTDLVHEAFIKLSNANVEYSSTKHYYHTLARQMRRVLINYSRYHDSDKNKGEALIYTDSLGLVDNNLTDFNLINNAIDELEILDSRSAQAVELIYFTNLSRYLAAELLDISVPTLERDLRFGRTFINEFIYNLGTQ